ncbi:amidohydrolase family protein [Litorivicinus sp.]|jgi:N-acetylglucosamine-6-phosphate deacetylase|nr:amidohydrolase family protein [Litorivicinus sp.]MDB9862866.1 amidohydrolase family protein [Litorivicinus sp.]MDC1209234.1 amidohydrolase family protein [Litorivicinus sp.]MDC1239429.1 amidohydrolase family protein [Litorivicinus sp.]MDC1466464.1 amidohydrolase family protein [Litorivicinus sp.]|tara:strand:- start:2009 stop:3088 length:1080 start_codon:yes stop_codon:yes gene_type:complete
MNKLIGHVVGSKSISCQCISFGSTVDELTNVSSAPDRWILPGILDLHNHGGGGGDVMDGESGIRQLAKTHAAFGMTGFLATTVTAEDDAIDRAIEAVNQVMFSRKSDEAKCLGVHLEGPYLSAFKLGAQPPKTRLVDAAKAAAWFKTGIVRVMTYAPEQDPDQVLPALAQRYDVRLQLGHTGCPYHLAESLLEAGVGITHLFNAMSGVHHRDPGVALAALNRADYAEIICDGVHVDPAAFHLARRMINQLYSVTDATAASGMPDGSYRLGSHEVEKVGCYVRLADGTLAGSAATAEGTVSNLLALGLDWLEISDFVSKRPASWIGYERGGEIRLGAPADFSVFSKDGLESVWIDGEQIR